MPEGTALMLSLRCRLQTGFGLIRQGPMCPGATLSCIAHSFAHHVFHTVLLASAVRSDMNRAGAFGASCALSVRVAHMSGGSPQQGWLD